MLAPCSPLWLKMALMRPTVDRSEGAVYATSNQGSVGEVYL